MVYVIQEIDFDNMENHDPIYSSLKCYSETQEEAQKIVDILDGRTKYKGWDGKYYPQYKIIPLGRLGD